MPTYAKGNPYSRIRDIDIDSAQKKRKDNFKNAIVSIDETRDVTVATI